MRCYFEAATEASPVLILGEADLEVIGCSGIFQPFCQVFLQCITINPVLNLNDTLLKMEPNKYFVN